MKRDAARAHLWFGTVLAALVLSLAAQGAAAKTLKPVDGPTCDVGQFAGALACEGAFSGNDSNTPLGGLFGISGWTRLAKVERTGTDGVLTLDTSGGRSGTWSVTDWGRHAVVMAVLKGGPTFVAYRVDTRKTEGDWNTAGLLKGSGRPGPDLGHMTLYAAETTAVPLPPAGWLMATALGGLAFLGGLGGTWRGA